MPSMKLYRLVIHSKSNADTGAANQPSSMVAMPGIGMDGRVNPTPHTTIPAAIACTAKRSPMERPFLSSRKETVATRAIEPTIQTLADAKPFVRKPVEGGTTA
jgi:hypothetical protein